MGSFPTGTYEQKRGREKDRNEGGERVGEVRGKVVPGEGVGEQRE